MKKIKKNWDDKQTIKLVSNFLDTYDDGELFVEEVLSENIFFDDNKIKNASFDHDKGFGLRAVYGEAMKFFHSSDLTEESINRAIKYLKSFQIKKKNIQN